jgi:hypothetical protein
MFSKIEKVIYLPFVFLFFYTFLLNPSLVEGNEKYQRYNMYSSDEKQFVWFRVFKVASTSTLEVLEAEVSDLAHTRPENFPKKFKNYFKFSFVRNPWDRVVSCYFNKVVTKKIRDFKECFDKDFDFFVDYINRIDVETANPHIKLQTTLIPVNKMDFIGKMDNFDNDFKFVCDVIGIKCDEIPHWYKTDHVHYSAYYTPRTMRIIAKKYKEDIETFGFTFEKE